MSLKDSQGYLNAKGWTVTVLAVIVGIFLFFMLIFGLAGLKKTPADKVGLSYGGGPFEGNHFQRQVPPASGIFFNGFFDKFYKYPVTQRNYIVSLNEDEGDRHKKDSIVAPSKDRIPVTFQIATYFKLNQAKIRKFHEQIGLKYGAWDDGDGWNQMLEGSFRQQIENALQEQTRKFEAGDIFSNADVLLKVQNDVATGLKDNINTVLGDEYFCGPTYHLGGECTGFKFIIKHVDLPDGTKQAYQDNKNSEIAVQTKRNEVAQREQEAQAIAKINAALNNTGGQYTILKAIESGKIQFWVLPNGQNITLPTPGK